MFLDQNLSVKMFFFNDIDVDIVQHLQFFYTNFT